MEGVSELFLVGPEVVCTEAPDGSSAFVSETCCLPSFVSPDDRRSSRRSSPMRFQVPTVFSAAARTRNCLRRLWVPLGS